MPLTAPQPILIRSAPITVADRRRRALDELAVLALLGELRAFERIFAPGTAPPRPS